MQFLYFVTALGSFFNCVKQIVYIIDHLSSIYVPLIGEGIPLLIYARENLHTVDISCTSYQPRLANLVCERPLTVSLGMYGFTAKSSVTTFDYHASY